MDERDLLVVTEDEPAKKPVDEKADRKDKAKDYDITKESLKDRKKSKANKKEEDAEEKPLSSMKIKKMVLTSLFIALGVILPIFVHTIPDGGKYLLPMHIPIFLAGMICGPFCGAVCAFVTPMLSLLFTGMPVIAKLPSLTFEFIVYAVAAGMILNRSMYKRKIKSIYIALIGAMICGRLIGGAVNALLFSAGEFMFDEWMVASFVTGLPGMMIQIVFIPIIVYIFKKTDFIGEGEEEPEVFNY